MALPPRTRLGPYEIVELAGSGGMGQVYKAVDTRLGRIVAIKTGSEQFSERFQSEARAIAALNHPNICTLHDVGPDYLVMEYVDGKPLHGPLPVTEVIRLGIQIADALSHAHRHGIVHRDLKPANVLVTKAGAKVLDFGIARIGLAAGAAVTAGAGALTCTITQEGSILGTPNYMAPEQIEGSGGDARSDIFAFGLLLYEMITGRRAFEGKTQGSVIAAILRSEPEPVSSLQPGVPRAVDFLIHTCLRKDPDRRWQNIHDVYLALRGIEDSPAEVTAASRRSVSRREWLWPGAAAFAGACALGVSAVHLRERPPESLTTRFQQPLPTGAVLHRTDIAQISPDGRKLAFVARESSTDVSMLYIRDLSSREIVAVPESADLSWPFWSPDSRVVAWFARDKLRKFDTNRRVAEIICDANSAAGGSWSSGNTILVGSWRGPLRAVSASGGTLSPILSSVSERGGDTNPHFLPDGRHFLFTRSSDDAKHDGIHVGSFDSQESRLLVNAISNGSFAEPGLLLFGRGRVLYGQPFDAAKQQLRGEPFVVADKVLRLPAFRYLSYSASRNGNLAYRTDSATDLRLVWSDRAGKRSGPASDARRYLQFGLSPDEKQVVAQAPDADLTNADLWLIDLSTGITSRVTSDPASDDTIVWSPDGKQIVFASYRSGQWNLYRKTLGGGDAQLVFPSQESVFPCQWLKDGSLLFQNINGRQFYRFRTGSAGHPEALFHTPFDKDGARVSPDGKWIAYNTNEPGQWQVYVAAFPGFTKRQQVSSMGGVQPQWSKDQKELFYLSPDGTLMSLPITNPSTMDTGAPRALFSTRVPVLPTADQYAITSNGRFLLLEPVGADAPEFQVVLNWPASVKLQ